MGPRQLALRTRLLGMSLLVSAIGAMTVVIMTPRMSLWVMVFIAAGAFGAFVAAMAVLSRRQFFKNDDSEDLAKAIARLDRHIRIG